MSSENLGNKSGNQFQNIPGSGAGNGTGGGIGSSSNKDAVDGQGSGGGTGQGTGGGGGQGGGVGGGGLGDLPGETNGGLFTIDGTTINTLNWRTIEIELTPKDEQFDATHHGSHNKDKIKGTAKNEHLKGYEHHDHLNGHKGHDHLRGGAGHDTLKGGAGNDLLIGAIDNDNLMGHKGKDLLFGGDDNDRLHGGKGKDIFILSSGKDVIKDFNLKQDSIGIKNNAGLSLITKQRGENLLLKGSDGIHTILQGINQDEFRAAFQTVNSSSAPGALIDIFQAGTM